MPLIDAAAIAIAMIATGCVGAYASELSEGITGLEVVPKRRISYAAAAAALAGIAAWSLGPSAMLVVWLPVIAIGVVLSAIDIAHHLLPNRLVLPLYPIVGVLLVLPVLAGSPMSMYVRALIAMVAVFGGYGALALIYPAGTGFGDVKLAGVLLGLGLGFLGWDVVFVGILAASLLCTAFSIAARLTGRLGRKAAVPFGPFILAGAVTALAFSAAGAP